MLQCKYCSGVLFFEFRFDKLVCFTRELPVSLVSLTCLQCRQSIVIYNCIVSCVQMEGRSCGACAFSREMFQQLSQHNAQTSDHHQEEVIGIALMLPYILNLSLSPHTLGCHG